MQHASFNHGWSMLHIACKQSSEPSLAILNSLLELKSDVNAQTVFGITPLMVASLHDNVIAVRILLQHGANAALRTKTGYNVIELLQNHKKEKN